MGLKLSVEPMLELEVFLLMVILMPPLILMVFSLALAILEVLRD